MLASETHTMPETVTPAGEQEKKSEWKTLLLEMRKDPRYSPEVIDDLIETAEYFIKTKADFSRAVLEKALPGLSDIEAERILKGIAADTGR